MHYVARLKPRLSGRPDRGQPRALRAERREELLGGLEELFLERGFSDLTLDDMAAHLRCSKSALYALAASKEQLVAAVIERFFEMANADIDRRVEDQDAAAQVLSYLTAVGDEMSRMSPACYADMVSVALTREIYDEHSRGLAARVRQMVDAGVASGELRAVNGEFVGQTITLVIEGIQHGALLEQVEMSRRDAYAELTKLMVAALSFDAGAVASGRP